jgi:hypothetical protein
VCRRREPDAAGLHRPTSDARDERGSGSLALRVSLSSGIASAAIRSFTNVRRGPLGSHGSRSRGSTAALSPCPRADIVAPARSHAPGRIWSTAKPVERMCASGESGSATASFPLRPCASGRPAGVRSSARSTRWGGRVRCRAASQPVVRCASQNAQKTKTATTGAEGAAICTGGGGTTMTRLAPRAAPLRPRDFALRQRFPQGHRHPRALGTR